MSASLDHLRHQRILVTGAAGFIGARVSELLLASGCHVFGLDNLNDYYSPTLKRYRLARLQENKRFQMVEADLLEQDHLDELVRLASPCDAVIHLAAQAGVRHSFVDPDAYFRSNVVGCFRMLEATTAAKIPKFILASTSTLYANAQPPFSESAKIGVPRSPYAESKKSAESLARYFHEAHALDVSVLRYFTVYGPAGRPDMAYFRFLQAIDQGQPIPLYGDGTQSRDFTFVDDIAKGTLAALTPNPSGFEIYNLGHGTQPVTIRQLITLLEEFLGKSARVTNLPQHEGDMDTTWANTTKAKSQWGWSPETDLESGLLAMVDWYQNNKSWTSRLSHK